MKTNIQKKLAYMEFLQRENSVTHHKYDDELLQFAYLSKGDMRSVDEVAARLKNAPNPARLSDNPLQSQKYLFVCFITTATRYAIEAGLPSEKAFNISDLYIRMVDKCTTTEQINEISLEMTGYFTQEVAKILNQTQYSKPVKLAMDYIYEHLHEKITVEDIAAEVGLNPSYLSTHFKRISGVSVSEYIRKKRIEAAENMLMFSAYSLSEISEFLSFSSYSHFAAIFQKYTGATPKEYRSTYYGKTEMIQKNRMRREDS